MKMEKKKMIEVKKNRIKRPTKLEPKEEGAVPPVVSFPKSLASGKKRKREDRRLDMSICKIMLQIQSDGESAILADL
jgi:hypothetical protein